VTWNVHKQVDAGWDRDLTRLLPGSDLVLLQEAALGAGLRPLLDGDGLRWVMASSFIYENDDFGVLTAARVPPLESCALRAVEPLLGIPKSGLVSWFALSGMPETLAVVNVHAINITLTLDTYAAQFAALAAALSAHRGPIVFGGDFNTWSDARLTAVRAAVAALSLVEVPLADDRRSHFLGQPVDHLLVRGLDAVDASAVAVTSSDHNPVRATLRVTGPR
jgi:endonuclease/exonuclease/phosphatase (EEP) superfamily protein YafD